MSGTGVASEVVGVSGPVLRAAGGVERGDRVGLVLGEQEFAFRLGEAGA